MNTEYRTEPYLLDLCLGTQEHKPDVVGQLVCRSNQAMVMIAVLMVVHILRYSVVCALAGMLTWLSLISKPCSLVGLVNAIHVHKPRHPSGL